MLPRTSTHVRLSHKLYVHQSDNYLLAASSKVDQLDLWFPFTMKESLTSTKTSMNTSLSSHYCGTLQNFLDLYANSKRLALVLNGSDFLIMSFPLVPRLHKTCAGAFNTRGQASLTSSPRERTNYENFFKKRLTLDTLVSN